jgi:hypothetical protein
MAEAGWVRNRSRGRVRWNKCGIESGVMDSNAKTGPRGGVGRLNDGSPYVTFCRMLMHVLCEKNIYQCKLKEGEKRKRKGCHMWIFKTNN